MAGHGNDGDGWRYEFRTFGQESEAAFHRLAGDAAEIVEQASEDVYLVAPGLQGAGLKIRQRRLDLKLLDCTDGPFERWRPAGFADLPLSGHDIACRFLRPAGLPVFIDEARDYGVEALIAAAATDRRVAPVRVAKRRRQAALGDDLVECAALRIDGIACRTGFAAESLQSPRLAGLVARAGLSGVRNVSYPRFLAGLVFGARDRGRGT